MPHRTNEPDYSHTDAYQQGYEAGLRKAHDATKLPDIRYRHLEALAAAGFNAITAFLEAVTRFRYMRTWDSCSANHKQWARDFATAILVEGADSETFHERRRKSFVEAGECDHSGPSFTTASFNCENTVIQDHLTWNELSPLTQQTFIVFRRTVETLALSLAVFEKTPHNCEAPSQNQPTEADKA